MKEIEQERKKDGGENEKIRRKWDRLLSIVLAYFLT